MTFDRGYSSVRREKNQSHAARFSKGVLLSLLASAALAQKAPDAGQLLAPLESPRPAPLPRVQGLQIPGASPKLLTPGEDKVLIEKIRFEGNAALSTQRLQAIVAPSLSRQLSLGQLEQLAETVEKAYRDLGYPLVFVGIPEQQLSDGSLLMQVFEGRVDNINITGDARLNPDVARRLIANSQPLKQPIRLDSMERAVMQLADLPGVRAEVELAPSGQAGGTDINVSLQNAPLVRGDVSADNQGNRFAGSARVLAGISLLNPLGDGEEFNARALVSEYQRYLRIGGSLPVTDGGARMQLYSSRLRYSLCCSFAPALINGTAKVYGLGWEQPLMRSQSHRSNLNFQIERKALVNNANGGNNSDKRITALSARWSGALVQASQEWSYGLSTELGRVNLSRNTANEAQDANTAGSQGFFSKFVGRVSLQHNLSPQSALLWRVDVQKANHNLDSSEKFSLGGPNDVRAYAQGEVSGDLGLSTSLEYRWLFQSEPQAKSRWLASAFLDHGTAYQHKRPWAGWNAASGVTNQVSLSGLGLSLAWRHSSGAQAKLSVAQAIGNNPVANAGLDSEGRSSQHRIWFESSWAF